MEEIFNKLKAAKKNTVDILIKWLQDSNLVEKSNASESKMREFFAGVANKSDVAIEEFKGAIEKMAGEQKKPSEDFTQKLGTEGSKFLTAIGGAAEAAASAVTGMLGNVMK